ncbi:MAG: sugar transferase [Acidobacteriota bacterium]|nr:sugar transferase [Acidobacteriota bacterium]
MMRLPEKLLDLLLITFGFVSALLIYNTLFLGGLKPYEMALGSGVSVLAFWAAVELSRGGDPAATAPWITFIEQFCLGTGINLLIHAVLTYAFYIRRTPFLIAAGGLIAAGLIAMRRTLSARRERSRRRFLLVGFDSIAHKVFQFMSEPLAGVLAARPALAPEGTPWLGPLSDLPKILQEQKPTNIVVSREDWQEQVAPNVLLASRLSGVMIEESAALYERFFSRVCCERLRPVDLLLSSSLRGDSRTIAVQSVYTNLVGLALLIALSPVMLLVALAIALFSGPGPILENVECAGFQYIPFRLQRFRTTERDSPRSTAVGRLVRRLRLANLPQLINVVRGDMAIVGPKPVRSEFAEYLTNLMPFYSHRFSVRPGMLGWAQIHTSRHTIADEALQIEYDLYYVKNGSLWMDVEIMLESLAPGRTANRNR